MVLQEISVQEFLKSVLVLISDWYIFLSENNPAAINCINFLKIHDKGAMNPHESAGRQFRFQDF